MEKILNDLYDKLKSMNIDMDKDEGGIYLNTYSIDIISEDNGSTLILSDEEGINYMSSVDEAVLFIKNKIVVEEARLKLAESSFKYKVVDSNHIYVLEHTVFSEDGVLVLEQNEGSLQKLSGADELIAELEEFSLNSEV